MFGRKGQAFDAFKLLIAAVVAGAILVILLQIIGGISLESEDPLRVMGQQLSRVRRGGVAATSNQVVQFRRGNEYEVSSVTSEAGMNPGDVVFCCNDASGGGTKCKNYVFKNGAEGDPFTCNDHKDTGSLIVDSDLAGRIRAYCPPSDSTNQCIIGFQPER